jgi:hypothetical protein
MAKLIEQPEQFRAELKVKWLDYYQTNRHWLKPLLVPNNGYWYESANYNKEELEDDKYQPCRPNSLFILGVISILEPEIQGLCNFVSLANPNEIIKSLGLDCDPELELKKRPQKPAYQQIPPDSQYLDSVREEIKT